MKIKKTSNELYFKAQARFKLTFSLKLVLRKIDISYPDSQYYVHANHKPLPVTLFIFHVSIILAIFLPDRANFRSKHTNKVTRVALNVRPN